MWTAYGCWALSLWKSFSILAKNNNNKQQHLVVVSRSFFWEGSVGGQKVAEMGMNERVSFGKQKVEI